MPAEGRENMTTTKAETKHTPGPWILDTDNIIRTEAGTCIALAQQGGDGYPLLSGDEVQANARLIAAAPELLEALQYVSRLLGDGYSGPVVLRNATDCDRAIFVSTINQAIAKATGKE
jgi:hypothetical protein